MLAILLVSSPVFLSPVKYVAKMRVCVNTG